MSTKITKSVILAPGETFSLPSNSKVLSISGNMSSTCGELPTPEPLECFTAIHFIAHGNSGQIEPLDSVYLQGVRIKGIDYLFTPQVEINLTSCPNSDCSSIFTGLINSNTYLSNVMTSPCYVRYDGGGSQGGQFGFSFKSMPSLMDGAFMIMESNKPAALPQGGNFKIYVPIVKRNTVTGLPGGFCPCS